MNQAKKTVTLHASPVTHTTPVKPETARLNVEDAKRAVEVAQVVLDGARSILAILGRA